MQNTKFEEVPLKNIVPDPKQPRKFYDEHAMEELVDSVRENGVIQPILVRPKGKGYMIVCGERRYRAALSVQSAFKDRNTIPAVISNISDEEAIELQIIENLQRKDVHPMEEAVAIKSLIDTNKFSISEIAARIGKKDWFVNQRLKLMDLAEGWQKLFYNNRLTLKEALQMAQLPLKDQQEWFDEVSEDVEDKTNFGVSLSDWSFNRFKGELHKATFDLSDTELDKNAGACTTCQFNTAANQLFPDDFKSPRCTNISCFKNKEDIHFKIELEKAKEDPIVILVTGYGPDTEVVKKLNKEGHAVLKVYEEYSKIEEPEKPDLSDHLENYESELEDGEMTKDEVLKMFDNDVLEYQKELEKYNKQVSSGKYKRAFVVDGSGKGEYIFIELKKKAMKASGGNTTSNEEGISVSDIDEEITRIRDREKRAKELDQNKMWQEIRKHFNPSANSSVLKNDFDSVERIAIATAMYDKLDYSVRGVFEKLFPIKPVKVKEKGKPADLLFPEMDKETFHQVCRFFMLSILPPTLLYSGLTENAILSLKIANKYFPNVLSDIELEFKQKEEKRLKRIDERIMKLQQQKREIQKEVNKKIDKPAAKKASPKKSAKTK